MVNSPLEHFELTTFTAWGGRLYKILELNNFYVFYLSILLIFIFFISLDILYSETENKEKLEGVSGLNGSLVLSSMGYFLEKFLGYFIFFSRSQFVSHRQLRYVTLFFTVFLSILFFNILSLVAFIPSVTGHLIVTFLFSISLFFGFIIIGFLNYDAEYLLYFVPKGVPKVLLPFLTIIEVLSFLIRPFSLGIRLFANMLAGHTLMGIFAKFGVYIIALNITWIFFPILIIVPVLFLEIGVALVQAYIFINLLYIYMNDVYSISH